MRVSVVIPTYNGAKSIVKTIPAYLRQTYLPNEIIIVIDGSQDDTEKVIQNFTSSLPIKVIKQPNSGRSVSRNKGVELATGELVVFYDDDIRPEKNSIERHIQFHSQYSNSIVSGQILEDPALSDKDIYQFKSYLSKKWTEKYKSGLNELSSENLFLTAANLSVRKEDFNRLGGFDKRLNDAEDYDLAARALHSGFKVCFDKDNVAWHDDIITCKNFIKRQKQYSEAHKQLVQLKPLYYKELMEKVPKLNLFKRCIYFLFSRKYWVNQIDMDHLLFLPRKVRYKLYDLVITGLSKVYPNVDIN